MGASSDVRHPAPPLPDRDVADTHPAAGEAWPGLETAAAAIGVPLSPPQLTQFASYRALLLEWNARFNLTAITDPAAIEERLFWDALLLLSELDALAHDHAPTLVDIGSGAGFPALPLAIMRPAWSFTLIEATGKKVAFLTAAIAVLALPRVTAVHGRAEDVARDPARRGSWQLATARAVASVPALIELTMPLLRVGGHAVLPKGLELAAELAAGERAADLVGARLERANRVPGTATRIVVVTKTRATPAAYPRRPGIPAREPLGMADRSPIAKRRRVTASRRTTLAGG